MTAPTITERRLAATLADWLLSPGVRNEYARTPEEVEQSLADVAEATADAHGGFDELCADLAGWLDRDPRVYDEPRDYIADHVSWSVVERLTRERVGAVDYFESVKEKS